MDDRDTSGATSNRLLAGMLPQDRKLLWPALRRERLRARSYLERKGAQPDCIYFPESGVVSILESGDLRDPLEVCVVGREGMTGASTIAGDLVPQRDSYVQIEGQALVLDRCEFRRFAGLSKTLPRFLLSYLQTQILQLSLAVSAAVRASLEQRLARKLLMYHDRTGCDNLPLTHENMSIMLGVRRASITTAIRKLEQQGWITSERGLIRVRDRPGLVACSGPFYGVAEQRYELIMARAPEASAMFARTARFVVNGIATAGG